MSVSRNGLLLAVALGLAYGLFVVIYDVLIEQSTYSAAIRMPRLIVTLHGLDLLLGLVYILLPFLWLRLSEMRPSKVLYIFFVFSILLPSVIFLSTNETMSFTERHGRALFCVFCFFIIYLPYFLPAPPIAEFRLQRAVGWPLMLGFLAVSCLYVVGLNPSALTSLNVLDVYGQRLEIREALASGSFSRINVYLTNWLGLAFAPFLVCYGIFYQRPRFVLLALVVAVLAFAISSHKSVLFSTVISGLFAVAIYYRVLFSWPRNRALNVALSLLVGFIVIPLVLDLALGQRLPISWLTTFRLFLNNGYLMSAYIEYFSGQEMLLYSESFLRAFIESNNDLSYTRRVGDYVMQYKANNNANANFLADGYANLGLAGMIFAALQLAVVLWFIDRLARGRNTAMVICMILPAGLAFSNVPIHTGLVSNGVAILLALITLLPRDQADPWFSGRQAL